MIAAFWIVSKSERYNDEEDIYGETSREGLVEDDEMSPEEDGFMKGYMDS